MAVDRQMHHLFVTILKDCAPTDPRALWDTFWQDICNDLKRHSVFHDWDAEPSEEEIQDWNCMPQVAGDWGTILQNQNPLIAEQRDYDLEKQAKLARQHKVTLNAD
jgi:hypothetical protein